MSAMISRMITQLADAIEGQQKIGLDDLGNGGAGETARRVQDHGDGDHIGGRGLGTGRSGERAIPGEQGGR